MIKPALLALLFRGLVASGLVVWAVLGCSKGDLESSEENGGRDDDDDDDDEGDDDTPDAGADDAGADDTTPKGATIDPDEGGRVTSADGRLRLEIPPGALAEETTVVITPLAADDVPAEFVGDGLSRVYRLEPDGLEFEEAVALSIAVGQGDIPEVVEDRNATEFAILGIESMSEAVGFEQVSIGIVKESEDEVSVIAALTHFSDVRANATGKIRLELDCVEECEVGPRFTGRASTISAGAVGTFKPTFDEVTADGMVSVDPLNLVHAVEGELEYWCREGGSGGVTVSAGGLSDPDQTVGARPNLGDFAATFFADEQLLTKRRVAVGCAERAEETDDDESAVTPPPPLAFERIEPDMGLPGEAIRLLVTGVEDDALLDTASVWFETEDGELRLDAMLMTAYRLEVGGEPTTDARIDVLVPQVNGAAEWRVLLEFSDPQGEMLTPEGNPPLFSVTRSVAGRWNMNQLRAGEEGCADPNPSTDWYFWPDWTWTDIGTTDAVLDDNTYAIIDGTWSLEDGQVFAESCENDFGDMVRFDGTYDSANQALAGTYTVIRDGGQPFVVEFCSQSYTRPIAGCIDTECQADRQPFVSSDCFGETCASTDGLQCLAGNGSPLCERNPMSQDQVIGCPIGEQCSHPSGCCECRDDPEFAGEGIWICGGRLLNEAGCPGLPVEEGQSCADTEVPLTCRYCSPAGQVSVQRCSAGVWENR